MKTAVHVALLVAFATPLHAQDFRVDVQEHRLANGVQVLVVERPAAGRVAARIFYKVDVAGERPGIWGSTHMLEHSMFKGSRFIGTRDWERERDVAMRVERLAREVEDERNRLSDLCRSREAYVVDELEPPCSHPRLDSLAAAFAAAVAEQDEFTLGTDLMRVYQFAGGTNMTASTGTDYMKFHIDLPADKLELFMYVERSRVEFPVFRQFDPEREVVVDQIRRRFNRPDGRFRREMQSLTYPAHPYGQSHWFSDLVGSQREDHWEIFYRFFIPQNTVIVVVGEIEAAIVFSLAERYFGDWLPGRPAPRVRTIQPAPAGQRRVHASARAGPTVAVNARIPAVGHPDLPALQVLAGVLGGTQGLLMRRLGDRATVANVNAQQRKYPGHISISVNARSNERLDEVESGIEDVLRSVVLGQAPQSDIDRAVAQLRFRRVRTFETIGGAATAIGAMHSIYDWRYVNDQPSLWAAVTPDDLARVTGEYLSPDRRIVGVLRREATSPDVVAWQELTDESRGDQAGGLRYASNPDYVALAVPDALAVDDEDWTEAPVPPLASNSVWWAPSWMPGQSVRFAGAAVPADYRDLEFEYTPFRQPRAEDYRTVFRNGLRAFVAPDPSIPIAKISVMIDVSTLDDALGREGITDLTLRAMRYGGTADLSPDEVETELAGLGASLSVSAGRDVARLELTAPAESGADAVRLITSLLTAPLFDESTVLRHRTRAAVRASRATDDPRELLDRTFQSQLYGASHPLARRPTQESIEAITRDHVIDWHRSRIVPERTVFAVSGMLDRETVIDILASAYDTREGGRAPAPRQRDLGEADAVGGAGVVQVERRGMRQAHVMMGHRGIAGVQDDQAALEIMHYVLAGGGFASRMMDLLRTQTGITAALFGRVEPGLGGPYPYQWRFSGNPETIAEGVRLALQQISAMYVNGVTQQEFENARTAYIEGLVPATYDTPHKTVTKLGYADLLGRYPYTAVQYLNYYAADAAQIEAMQSLTVEDVNRAARRYLDPENMIVVVVGDLDTIREHATPEALEVLAQLD